LQADLHHQTSFDSWHREDAGIPNSRARIRAQKSDFFGVHIGGYRRNFGGHIGG